MFKKISYLLALQFTAFVFVLLLINGSLFLAADFRNAHQQTQRRLGTSLRLVLERIEPDTFRLAAPLPPMIREHVRVLDANGSIMYTGDLFSGIPFEPNRELKTVTIQGEQYTILTTTILRHERLSGYVQIADLERLQLGDIPRRATLYIMLSVIVSVLTFMVGLFFARRSLRPAVSMVEQLEQFTQDASHELRTPLAVLNSSLDLALRNENYKEGLVSAKQDVKEISVLVERLLELARLDKFTLERESVDLSALVRDSVEKYKLLAEEKGLTIDANVKDGVHVHGDQALLRQVLGNLLSNAMKFNKEKGAIRVKLADKGLTVEDTGIGIDPQDLSRIFNRFYQADTSRANDGFGLGLALVKRIVDLHGWSITAKSKPGEGTAFTIHFSSASRPKKVS